MDKLVEKINRLIVRIAKGDTYALDELFVITGRMLLFMARKYLYNKSYAEDLVSETYLKVVKSADSFDKKQNGLNWLYKIVKNGALNHNLKERNLTEPILENVADKDFASEWLDTILVENAVSTLSDEEKDLIYLRYWEGYGIQEIADKLGKPLSTTHDMLKRTCKKLKQLLNTEK
ncbi:MAG: RNA polymerase sigma factor [Clostridia bacterium]|nr:RNA polymerase sigma factor [Clostridia bacterium]